MAASFHFWTAPLTLAQILKVRLPALPPDVRRGFASPFC